MHYIRTCLMAFFLPIPYLHKLLELTQGHTFFQRSVKRCIAFLPGMHPFDAIHRTANIHISFFFCLQSSLHYCYWSSGIRLPYCRRSSFSPPSLTFYSPLSSRPSMHSPKFVPLATMSTDCPLDGPARFDRLHSVLTPCSRPCPPQPTRHRPSKQSTNKPSARR